MHDFFDLRNAISCSARALSDKGPFGRRARGRATGEAISPLPKSFEYFLFGIFVQGITAANAA